MVRPKPSSLPKPRILLLKLSSKSSCFPDNAGLIVTAVINELTQLFGPQGPAKFLAYSKIKYWCPITGVCVLRVTTGNREQVTKALENIHTIGGIPTRICVIKVSGLMRCLSSLVEELSLRRLDDIKADATCRLQVHTRLQSYPRY